MKDIINKAIFSFAFFLLKVMNSNETTIKLLLHGSDFPLFAFFIPPTTQARPLSSPFAIFVVKPTTPTQQ